MGAIPPPLAPSVKPQLGRTVLVGGPPDSRREYQSWIDAARLNVREARTIVDFREANCPGGRAHQVSACIIEAPTTGDRIRFYVPADLRDPQQYDPVDLRNTVLHELGHVYDFTYNRDHHRSAFMKLFALPGRFYDPGKSPAYERFAVGYSYCAERLTYDQAVARFPFDSYQHRFTPAQYAATCQMLQPPLDAGVAARVPVRPVPPKPVPALARAK